MSTENVTAIETAREKPRLTARKVKGPKARVPRVHFELDDAIETLDNARSVASILRYAVEEGGDEEAHATLCVIVLQLHAVRDKLSKVSDRLYSEGVLPGKQS